jgi:2,4-dienoyl-CoA reductase-like NADH-dependent reductase (Old Yellow Enzyme family)
MRKSSTPITIGSKTVKNRITFAPTVKFGWSDNSGIANPRFARHYEERAAGATGLIVVEATCICPEGRLAPSQLGLWEDGHIAGHRAITEACHKHGLWCWFRYITAAITLTRNAAPQRAPL